MRTKFAFEIDWPFSIVFANKARFRYFIIIIIILICISKHWTMNRERETPETTEFGGKVRKNVSHQAVAMEKGPIGVNLKGVIPIGLK